MRAAREVAPEALRLTEGLGDAARASKVCLMALDALGAYLPGTIMGMPEGQEWAEQADRYAAPETADRAHANLYLSMVGRMAGRLREARDQVLSALELARRLGDAEGMFVAARQAMVSDWLPEHQRDGLRVADEAAAWPRTGVGARALASTLDWCGHAYLSWGDRARAEQLWRDVAELAARTRHPVTTATSLRDEIILATVDGRLDEAVDLDTRRRARAEEMGLTVQGHTNFGALIYLGQAEEALAAAEQGAGVLGERGVRAAWRAVCLAHMGRDREASQAARSALAEWSFGPGHDEIRMDVLALLLEAAAVIGDRELAPMLAARTAGLGSPAFVQSTNLVCIPRHLGAIAALMGDRKKAMAYYEQALEICQKLRFRPEIALTRLAIGELLLDEALSRQRSAVSSGEGEGKPIADKLKAEGLEHLDFAIDDFRAMKMQPSLERALRHKGLLSA